MVFKHEKCQDFRCSSPLQVMTKFNTTLCLPLAEGWLVILDSQLTGAFNNLDTCELSIQTKHIKQTKTRLNNTEQD